MNHGPAPEEILEELAKQELKFSNRETNTFRMPQQAVDQLHLHGQKMSGADPFRELIASIALEEAAIARLIHAEANKVQAFTGEGSHFPTSPTNEQINDFQNALARVLEALVEKQKLLIRMIEMSKRLVNQEADKHG